MSNAVKKLTECMEKLFKESPEARKAMRDWLDELELEQHRVGVITVAASGNKAEPQRPKLLGQARVAFTINPEDYKWELERIVDGNHGIFIREFKSGLVKLRYYFTSGTIQLVYPKSKHPKYAKAMKETAHNNGNANNQVVKQIVENFHLDEDTFEKLLTNAPLFFGRGVEEGENKLEKTEPATNKSIFVSLPTITVVQNSAEPAKPKHFSVKTAEPLKGQYYGNVRAHFESDPGDYTWTLHKIVGGNHAIYEREFKYGIVKLRYYYTTGTIQLVYPKYKHPLYAREERDRLMEWNLNAERYGWDSSDVHVPHVAENFRNLTEEEFKKILKNATPSFGKGYI
jgi:hypothetical protein